MTDPRLAALLHPVRGVLLDFDGPVTALMPAPINWEIAESMRLVARTHGAELDPDLLVTADPLVILRGTFGHVPPAVYDEIETACVAGELEAASKSMPTAGSWELLDAIRAALGRSAVVVSNNSTICIETYLRRHQRVDDVLGIRGRPKARPDLMKPNPALLNEAVELLREPPEHCVFVGDSVSDIVAAEAAKVPSIGFAKHPRRGEELGEAGADALVESMGELTQALLQVH